MKEIVSTMILAYKNDNFSQFNTVKKEVPIIRLKNTLSGYYALVPNYKKHFPGEYLIEPDGWCRLNKSENPDLKR